MHSVGAVDVTETSDPVTEDNGTADDADDDRTIPLSEDAVALFHSADAQYAHAVLRRYGVLHARRPSPPIPRALLGSP